METTTTKTAESGAAKKIQVLSASVVNKIAAGEVIERPASVVKELLENSVDAGSTRIDVAIENGGMDLIRITDNGSGMAKDQLELAVTSHATSKISSAEELFRVGTFGFRGEALASIAEVSQFTMRSRTQDSDCGFELIVNGGHREPINPVGCPIGTTIEVRNLLYNTPVRRKFMRTPQTERGHIAEAFTRIALANPHVHLTLTHNERSQYDLPPSEDWQGRIADFFGPEIAAGLIPVKSSGGGISIEGFVVEPSLNRANNRMQYLFLNGRYIRDRSLQHALVESYRGLLMTGRYPIAFLQLVMPPDQVDVNVHPAKLEVRFQDSGRLYSQLLSTIRNKFLTTDLTAQAKLNRPKPVTPVNSQQAPTPTENQSRMPFQSSAQPKDWTQAPMRSSLPTSHQPTSPASSGSANFSASPFGRIDAGQPTGPDSTSRQPASNSFSVHDAVNAAETTGPHRTLALQIHNTYLITESEEGMVVIDQHALHERIIYEQLREKVLAGKLETQKLLVPEPVSLPPTEAAAVLEKSDLLKQIGMIVEPFGGDTVLVSGYPAMLTNHNPAEMLRGIVDLILADGRELDQRDLVDELLHMMSCKAAVKAGDKLTPEEISDLLDYRDYCQDAHHCPHGRPTSLVFSREDLDRKFKRI